MIVESFNLNPSVIVNGVDIVGGNLVGLDTGFFNYFVPTTPIAGGGTYSFSLYLHYDGSQSLADLTFANPHGTAPACGYAPQIFPRPSAGHRQIRPSAPSRPPFPSRRRMC